MVYKVAAVVLAGGGRIREKANPDNGPDKTLVKIGARIMADYVVTALKNCPDVSKIVMVGPEFLREFFREEPGLLYATPGTTPLGSFASGVAVLDKQPDSDPDSWILACAGDTPFLTVAAVSDFLSRCRERDADFYYPIIPRQAAEKSFPGVKRTYVRLQDGVFTGGNLFLANRHIIDSCLPRAEEFIRLRKKPTALARLVGFGVLWKYLIGQLTLQEAEQRVSRLFGFRGAAVITPYPEIGVDVDKPSDLELARRVLVSPVN